METKMRFILAISSVLFASSLFGQGGDIHTVIGDGDRTVERADRTPLYPRIIDTTIPTPIVQYPLLQLNYKTETEIGMITPASIKMKENLSKLYHSYLKLGIGSEFMPLGEYYFDAKRSRKFIYGAHIKHLSSFGNITGYAPAQFDRTRAEIYGGINEKRYSLRGDVHYNNQGLHYYGIPIDSLISDSIAQRYSDFGFGAEFRSHIKDSAKLNYSVGIDYNNYLSKKREDEALRDWRARENYFAINTGGKYRMGSEVFAADLNIRYNGYKYGIADSALVALDSGIVRNNTVINFHPTIVTQRQNNRLKVRFGGNLVFDVDEKTKVRFYPDIEAKYSMFNDIFIPYIGLRGGLNQVSFKSLTTENEFLLSNLNMRNEHTPLDFYGGIKGTLSKRIGFNIGARFANIKDKALFVTDTTYSIGNKFTVITDTMNVATIEGSISYQLSNKLKVDAIGKFNSYTLLNNSYAWNLPQLEILVRGSYNLFDKFIFNLDVDLEHGRKALVYGPGEDVFIENNQYVKTLGFIADANLGVEYRYNERISAFVQLNNFASQKYTRWYNAPVQAFQVLGGVTFRF